MKHKNVKRMQTKRQPSRTSKPRGPECPKTQTTLFSAKSLEPDPRITAQHFRSSARLLSASWDPKAKIRASRLETCSSSL